MNIAAILLAAGLGTRFGGDKLSAQIGGKPMIAHACELHASLPYALFVAVVRPGDAVVTETAGRTALLAYNPTPERGIASSVRIGLRTALDAAAARGIRLDGALFGVADQPYLSRDTVLRLVERFETEPKRIVAPSAPDGKRGNPVIFPEGCFAELLAIEGDHGGGTVIRRHPELLRTVKVPEEDLRDVDVRPETEIG